jgi:hypothetical protein
VGLVNRPSNAATAPKWRKRSSLEKFLRRSVHRLRKNDRRVTVRRGPGYVEYSAPNVVLLQSEREPERKTGIYLRGACDLDGLFAAVPMFREQVRGTLCMFRAPGGISSARADVLLQTLQGIPPEITEETLRRLRLPNGYLSPDLFDPTFEPKAVQQFGPMPKSIVVLSLAPNVTRTLYRHREHGFLIDPGGSWLNQNVDVALEDKETIAWFAKNFQKVGRLTVDQFSEHLTTLVHELRSRTGAEIVMTNLLTVEPSDRTHNFQLRPHPEGLRRRQFNLALVDLSRELGIHVLDIDRALKRKGIDPSIDFAHFGGHSYSAVADAACRVFQELDAI